MKASVSGHYTTSVHNRNDLKNSLKIFRYLHQHVSSYKWSFFPCRWINRNLVMSATKWCRWVVSLSLRHALLTRRGDQMQPGWRSSSRTSGSCRNSTSWCSAACTRKSTICGTETEVNTINKARKGKKFKNVWCRIFDFYFLL